MNISGNAISDAVYADCADQKRFETSSFSISPAGNHSTGILKLIALCFMLIDHLGAAVFTWIPEMRILGRLAFPIYCWCLVVGFHYSKSVPKYLGRIILTGILVQPLYAQVMNHRINTENLFLSFYQAKPNIFFTLFLGLAALWGIREKKWFSNLWAPVAAVFLAVLLNTDYDWKGVLFILLLYAASISRPAIAAVMIAFFLYWGTGYRVTGSLFGVPLNISQLPGFLSQPIGAFLRLETYGLLSLPFILIRFRKNIHLPRWLSYCLYPSHLLIVWAVKLIIG